MRIVIICLSFILGFILSYVLYIMIQLSFSDMTFIFPTCIVYTILLYVLRIGIAALRIPHKPKPQSLQFQHYLEEKPGTTIQNRAYLRRQNRRR